MALEDRYGPASRCRNGHGPAHALELPGKLRLSKDQYLAVQAIYYPGFRFGGVAEPLSIAAVAWLALLTPPAGAGFWLTVSACIALLLTHAIYWLGIHPVNSFWLRDIRLEHAIRAFFAVDSGVGNRLNWLNGPIFEIAGNIPTSCVRYLPLPPLSFS